MVDGDGLPGGKAWWNWRLRQRSNAPTEAEHSVQDLYGELVKDKLSPEFRRIGFTGSGGRFALPDADTWRLMSLQKSVYNDASEVRFTINLLRVPKVVWEEHRANSPHLSAKPSASIHYGSWCRTARVGNLLPSREDTWWRIYSGCDLEAVYSDVATSIASYGLPWLRSDSGKGHGA